MAGQKEEDSMPIAKPVTATLNSKSNKTGKTNLKRQKIRKESKANLKRQKIRKESKANLKKTEVIFSAKNKEDSCCFGSKGREYRICDASVYVKGFRRLRPRDEIKNELINIFASCGELKSVFVPMQCGTCVPLGFAFLNLQNGQENALKLNGSYVQGRKLRVMMATCSPEYFGYPPNFTGCDLCRGLAKLKLRSLPPFDVDKAFFERYGRVYKRPISHERLVQKNQKLSPEAPTPPAPTV